MTPSLSYAAAASHSSSASSAPAQTSSQSNSTQYNSSPSPQRPTPIPRKRSPSPTHKPKTTTDQEDVCVLTLLTDKPHHDRMTQLRKRYFPAHRNKLAAHITLFHALPQNKLESSIIPALDQIVSQTKMFEVHASRPFRLKSGIAIAIPKTHGAERAQEIHRAIRQPWLEEGFLSDQDAGGFSPHYTIMNKVDDQAEVDEAFDEVTNAWSGPDKGVAEGLGLWRYDRGWWHWVRKFEFQKSAPE